MINAARDPHILIRLRFQLSGLTQAIGHLFGLDSRCFYDACEMHLEFKMHDDAFELTCQTM